MLREVKHGMNFMNGVFEDVKVKIQSVMKGNAELKWENGQFRFKCGTLERDVKERTARIAHRKQYCGNANLKIEGVPKIDNKNAFKVLGKICELIGEPIAYTKIEHATVFLPAILEKAVSLNNPEAGVCMTWCSKKQKMSVFRTPISACLVLHLFINKHLCLALKWLLGMAISRKKQSGWQYM